MYNDPEFSTHWQYSHMNFYMNIVISSASKNTDLMMTCHKVRTCSLPSCSTQVNCCVDIKGVALMHTYMWHNGLWNQTRNTVTPYCTHLRRSYDLHTQIQFAVQKPGWPPMTSTLVHNCDDTKAYKCYVTNIRFLTEGISDCRWFTKSSNATPSNTASRLATVTPHYQTL